MLRLPPFTLLRPRSVAEAVEILADHGARAMPVAGGTDVFPKMKRRQFEPGILVGLRGVDELRGISSSATSGVAIGAGESLAKVAADPGLRRAYGALAIAANSVSTPQLRVMGTIGGNLAVDTRCNYYDMSYHWRESIGFCLKKDGDTCLVAPSSPRCWAVSSSDTAPALIALGARVTLRSVGGTRTIDVHDLYRNDGIHYLTKRPDEVITRIEIPPADSLQSTYLKLRRRDSFDFPILGVAVALKLEGHDVMDARIVLGAVGSRPIRATAAEALLVGNRATPELLDEVAQRAGDPAKPLDNADLAPHWRKQMSRVFVRRALTSLAGLGPPSGEERLPEGLGA